MTSSSPPPTNSLYNGEASAVAGVPCYYYQAQSSSAPPNTLPYNYLAPEGGEGSYGHAMYYPRPPNELIPVLGTHEGDLPTAHIEGNDGHGNNVNNNNKPPSAGKPKLQPL